MLSSTAAAVEQHSRYPWTIRLKVLARLTTENQASVERLRDVDERLLAGEAAEDPIAHFDELVRDSLNSPNESRLGLGRLRAEADLAVSHRISDNTISIRVRRRILKTGSGDN